MTKTNWSLLSQFMTDYAASSPSLWAIFHYISFLISYSPLHIWDQIPSYFHFQSPVPVSEIYHLVTAGTKVSFSALRHVLILKMNKASETRLKSFHWETICIYRYWLSGTSVFAFLSITQPICLKLWLI